MTDQIKPLEIFETDPEAAIAEVEAAIAEVIRRRRALDSHTFDHLTDFCCHCGQGRDHVLETWIECFAQPNLIAISHVRRGQIADDLDRMVDLVEPRHRDRLRRLLTEPSPWDPPNGPSAA